MKAVCVINGSIQGTVIFTQKNFSDVVKIVGKVRGLEKGYHGIHIHEFGDNTNGCSSAGDHYNPFKNDHGAPSDCNRHVGDLGNINREDFIIYDNIITLFGKYSIIGRSLVIHADRDDLGKGGHPLSKTTGNSGSRIGCGVIGLSK